MLNIERAWRAAAGYLPILATVASLAPVAAVAHTGIGVVVLGVAVCLSLRRRADESVRPLAGLVRVGLATIGIGLLGAAFAASLAAGDAAFLTVLFASRLAGRFGARWAWIGRALLLPLTALFLAPPVAVDHANPLLSLGWAALACLVAAGWSMLLPAWLPRPGPGAGPLRRAVRRALAAPTDAAAAQALTRAGVALDRALAGDDAARHRLARLEYTVDRFRAGAANQSDVDDQLAALVVAVRGFRRGPVPTPVVDPADAPSPTTRTRMAIQSTLAVALAFVAGQTLFPDHWPWTIITVITVSFAARSRGEVVLRSGQRLAGAALATIVATPAATALAGNRPAMVAVILIVLGLGLYLRERSYLWWAMAVTVSLAFLYGLLGQTGGFGLLRERLLAIGLGAVCAIAPALLLAPRSRDLVRKRAATCLRRLREAIDGPDLAALRRLDAAVDDLRTASLPLRIVRPLRRSPEADWADAFATCGAPLRTLLAGPDPAATGQLRGVLAEVAAQVRATRRGGPST